MLIVADLVSLNNTYPIFFNVVREESVRVFLRMDNHIFAQYLSTPS